jgi:hypothetical protein
MVGKLRNGYELVFLIAPPVLSEAGPAQAAGRQADAVVAGLGEGKARGREGRGVRAAVRALPVPALGTIAVAVPEWVQRS